MSSYWNILTLKIYKFTSSLIVSIRSILYELRPKNVHNCGSLNIEMAFDKVLRESLIYTDLSSLKVMKSRPD